MFLSQEITIMKFKSAIAIVFDFLNCEMTGSNKALLLHNEFIVHCSVRELH